MQKTFLIENTIFFNFEQTFSSSKCYRFRDIYENHQKLLDSLLSPQKTTFLPLGGSDHL